MKLLLFCADWCTSCRDFRPHFDSLNTAALSKSWIDIERDASSMGEIEIENLPTALVISDDESSWYFGAIPPKIVFLEKLIADIERGKIQSSPLEGKFINLLQRL